MKLTAGLLYFDSETYARRCLETLLAQERLGALGAEWQIVCLNNGSKDAAPFENLKEQFPGVIFETSQTNLGFGAGHNHIIRTHPADFHAVLNIDVLFATNFLGAVLDRLEESNQAGSACGKLLHWDIDQGTNDERTNIIDSVGIGVTGTHHFSDVGQGKRDGGQYNEECERFGGSGAAVLYRRTALDHVAYEIGGKREYFDETMFAYKEDIDLAYRLQTAGHPCLYVPDALAWHARTLGRKQRKIVNPQMRAWSAANESLLLKKHRRWIPMKIYASTSARQLLKWTYLAVREPNVFARAQALLREKKKEARLRRKQTKHIVPFKDISQLFS